MLRILASSIIVLSFCIHEPARADSEVTTSSLLDWSDWEKHRSTVPHPVLRIRAADITRARENIGRHDWARRYAQTVERDPARWVGQLTPDFLVRMIPDTTPISNLFTPCPACRDLKQPYLPHGTWKWQPHRPDQLECEVCKTVFPNKQYPESIRLQSSWGRPQSFSWCDVEPFQVFGFKTGLPSPSGCIRSRKCLFMVDLARKSAESWALTGKPQYAAACRRILLRFAEVYPFYLVHTAYGEIADMSPREAAFAMNRLPKPELTYPPNTPNFRLFTDFWTAGRLSGSGIEGILIRQLAEAYDLTCSAQSENGSPLYSDEERITIERDLLLEGTVLAVADPGLNNKSVANRASVGIVGACVGHPVLARFGIDAFRKTIDEWFLPDGGTPESSSYGLMAISGVRDFSLVFRNYSDPPGWTDAQGKRLDNFDIFRNSSYPHIWKAFIDTLQGDLTFPPFADSRKGTRFPPVDAEILAAMYPDEPRYGALLHELSGPAGAPGDVSAAVYLRSADTQTTDAVALQLPDNCLPDLRIGFMRTGTNGRESLLLLNASRWGGHHHSDSLNLYYWKAGHELLTDLGYLWDHPDEDMTFRTFAHNLVMIDEVKQETKKRGGDVHFFHTSEHVKAMRASSQAYTTAGLYRRTSAIIDHGEGRSYVVDFFETEGGETQDYVYHGPTALAAHTGIKLSPAKDAIYDLSDVRSGETDDPWSLKWNLGAEMQFTAWNIPQPGERPFIGAGWGQRDSRNQDRGTTVSYVVRRCVGNELRCFASVFEGSRSGESCVRSVRRAALPNDETTASVALEIETTLGRDYVIMRTEPGEAGTQIPRGPLLPPGTLAVVSTQNGKTAWTSQAP